MSHNITVETALSKHLKEKRYNFDFEDIELKKENAHKKN